MIQLSPKDPLEVVPITFDFTSLLSSISSATVSIVVLSGVDAAVATMPSGTPAISGSSVQQSVQNGVDGVRYIVRADAIGPDGEFALAAILPVTDAEKQ